MTYSLSEVSGRRRLLPGGMYMLPQHKEEAAFTVSSEIDRKCSIPCSCTTSSRRKKYGIVTAGQIGKHAVEADEFGGCTEMKTDLRVFVVDDFPTTAYTLSSVLRDGGHSVMPYTDPVRALNDALQSPPDVLISDVEMPDLGGVDLAMRVQ